LFVLYDRSYRLCRRHLSEVPKLISSARQRIPNAFVTLTLYDPDLIIAFAQKINEPTLHRRDSLPRHREHNP
jgi:hypothetical protein